MVVQRRVGPLLTLLAAGLALLLARAFQVQVLEHGIWAGEAASMLQSSEVLPYHRGRILDRAGVVLARDEDGSEIRLCYRDFRRGNPIAQVAHARSTLEMRAVPLPEAGEHLEPWAEELVGLRPLELRGFARGGALPIGQVPELDEQDARIGLRDRRASDLRYYAAELLELPPNRRACLAPDKETPEESRTLLELAAAERGLAPDALRGELRRRLAGAHARLAHLAELVERDSGQPAGSGSTAFARLLELLEAERRDIEDDTADALFREAAGFEPGRVRTRLLEQRFDTAWIGRALRWDDARRHEWLASARTQWESSVAEVLLPRVLLRAQEDPIRARRADRMLSELVRLWRPAADGARADDGQPRSWLEFDEPCVLAELDTLFEGSSGSRSPDGVRTALPFLNESLAQLAREEEDRWRVVGALCDLACGAEIKPVVRVLPAGWVPPAGPLEAAQRWRRIGAGDGRLDDDAGLVELSWLAFAIEERFQGELERQLDLLYERSGATSPLAFDADRRSRAAEAERYLLLDRSTRPAVVCRQPSWELVELVTRSAGAYEGFSVRPTSKRLRPERDSADVELAAGLVGSVRRPRLSDLFSQGRERARREALRGKLVRSAQEEAELRDISLRLYRNDEWTGGTGVEALCDRQLRGQNGFQESFSLSDEVQAADAQLARAPVDGQDVVLTLDAGLQRAAQEVLAHPVMPNGEESDQLWCQYPVGAIVLLSPDGDLLAAASAPGRSGLPPTPGRDAEHSHLRERTLHMPTANPPGSAFKPFVAAYALERRGFDEGTLFSCSELKLGGHGYKTIHCHGHGTIALHTALVESCNAYFGQLAEACYKPEDFVAMTHVFGFGEPTGLSELDEQQRTLLSEDYLIPQAPFLLDELRDHGRSMRFACGLYPMEATPMQVARATAGLATGTLPQVRLVRSVGGTERPRSSRPLGISEKSLAFVRQALENVVDERGGTAHISGLAASTLGFSFACKTGSADWKTFVDSPELTAADRADMLAHKWRKHTWIAGWFPAEKPRAILVVYLHDVSETATGSSVFIAAQFLQQEAVRRFACQAEEQPK